METFADSNYLISIDKVFSKGSAGFIQLKLMTNPDSKEFNIPVCVSENISIRKVLFHGPSMALVHVQDLTHLKTKRTVKNQLLSLDLQQ